MKIAYLIREGLEQITSPCYYELPLQLKKAGHKVTVLNLTGKFGGLNCIKVLPKRTIDYPSGAFNRLNYSKAVLPILKELNPDIIFGSFAESIYHLKNLRIPMVVVVHDEWSERLKETPWAKNFALTRIPRTPIKIPLPIQSKFRLLYDVPLQKKCFELADGVIFVNKEFKNKNPHKNSVFIPNAVSMKKLSEDKKEINSIKKQFNKKIVLFFGRLELQKNPETFVNAAEIVLRKRNDAVFLIAGRGEDEKKIRKLIESKNLQENVKLLGWVSGKQKPAMLFASDIFVLPSLFEPFGVAAVEAMYCKNAVVVSGVGGLKDLIVEGKSGLFFEKRNFEQLAEKIIFLLDNPEKAKNLALNARKFVEKEFNWPKVSKQYLDFFNKTINGVKK